ncbi:MAG: hypothetical protein C0599_09405 [Salinivirgaceae bacterium]|nr:MAG: hypothetical protein C0599_09405 [Salinivirgaceae bacterium]
MIIKNLPGIIMRHQIFILLISFLLINCNSESKEKVVHEQTFDSIKDDSEIGRKTSQNEEINPKTQYLKSFLLEPINLIEFKNKYGPSNSGGCCSGIPIKWLYKPEKEGFYYQYMLFRQLKGMRYVNGKIMGEGELFKNFKIYVYHFGENRDFDFYNNDEELIGFSCAGIHEALGQANIVGKSLEEIEELFGNEYIEFDSLKIYYLENRVLSLKLKSSKVEWFKYFNHSSKLEEDKIPEHLIKF